MTQPLPPGFTLDAPSVSAPPALPSGFALDPRADIGNSVVDGISTGQDVLNSAGSGLATGAISTAGMPGDLASWVGDRVGDLSGLPIPFVGGQLPAQQKTISGVARRLIPIAGQVPTSKELQDTVTNVTGFTPYVPKTAAGRYAETAARFVPAAAAFGLSGGLSAVPAAVGTGLFGGLASQAGGDAAATFLGEKYRPYGSLTGALVGGGIPALGRRAVTPFPAPAARTAAVNALNNEGVRDLTAGQMTGNPSLRNMESEVGGTPVANMMENQSDQYTHAVLARAGVNANRATPDVIDGAFNHLGTQFDAIGSRNTLVADPQLRQDVPAAANTYFDNVNTPNRAPIVTNYLTEIGHAVGSNNGTIPGDVYQSLRSRIATSARNASDPDVQQALNGMRDALDAGMERSIAANNPADLGAWQQTRTQYRNLLVATKAASGAGAQAAQGVITPASLRTATQSVTGQRAYARGNTDFDELARSGITVMSPVPNSGTAGRLAARSVIATPAVLGAALAGGATQGDVWAALAGGATASAATAALRAALLSRPGRAYLANQLWTNNGGAPASSTLAAALTNATQPYRLPPPPVLGYSGRLPSVGGSSGG